MSEILEYALRLHIFPFTVMLVLVALFWLTVIFGAADVSIFDFDVDVDVDADIDVDAGGESSLLKGVAEFFNLAEVPVMVVLSFFTLYGWSGFVYLDSIFNESNNPWFGWALWVPIFFGASILAKYCAKPFGKFFKMLNADNEEKTEAIGSMCVLLQDTNGKHGRGQILTASSPVDILCYTDGEVLKQGEKALVLSWSEERRKYLVTKY